MRCALAAAILCLLAMFGAQAATMTFDADRMAVVEGKRTFILGLYETPKEEAVYQQAADAGFNLVYAGENMEVLDKLQAHGLHAWINTGGRIDFSADADGQREKLRALVAEYGAHPALLVWEVPDEALWNCWHLASEWRRGAEPRQQREKIAALEDKALAAHLMEDRDNVEKLYAMGCPAEAEALANAIWEALGETQPNPTLNIADAQARSEIMAAGMVEGHKFLRELDPAHPVWMNHAPRNSIPQMAMFNHGADMVGCDIYPVPKSATVGHSDIMNQMVSSVGAYTLRMQEAAPGKPVWMVLQGFGWADIQPGSTPEQKKAHRRPTVAESRFMAYDAVVRGARAVLYWGTMAVEKDSPFWSELLGVVRELADLQPLLSAPDAGPLLVADMAPTWGSVDRGVVALPKQMDGGNWFIVVNEWQDPVAYSLPVGLELNGKRYTDPAAGVSATVEKGVLTLPIPAHGVQILRPE
ncbi:MAG: hypothetical protein GX580_10645 [Candidatus Hydrogenedens sp.]|nr:hypothetical protein [Candidatus Hydrogenedentota bacterium]NLF58084.1 hypothetical protein [Candidatus Hydrogenedens sp.]